MGKNMTVEEAAERTGATPHFIRMAIEQGHFPGCFIKDGKRASYHIPREAVEDYMTKSHGLNMDDLASAIAEKLKMTIQTDGHIHNNK